MGKYYDEIELRQILVNTRSVSSDPNKLFAAFAVSSLADAVLNDGDNGDDEGENETLEDLWGKKIEKRVFDRLLADTIDDFTSAIDNDVQVSIFGSPYSIRNSGKMKREKMAGIFDFDLADGYYIISRQRICDVNGTVSSYADKKERLEDTRLYFKKIVYVVEVEKDGWYQLTDMEASWYCFGRFLQKCDGSFDLEKFEKRYAEICNLTLKETLSCTDNGKLESLWSFRADKIRAWNKNNGQTSIIDGVDKKRAEEFYYNT